jgi:hypothetical protein
MIPTSKRLKPQIVVQLVLSTASAGFRSTTARIQQVRLIITAELSAGWLGISSRKALPSNDFFCFYDCLASPVSVFTRQHG